LRPALSRLLLRRNPALRPRLEPLGLKTIACAGSTRSSSPPRMPSLRHPPAGRWPRSWRWSGCGRWLPPRRRNGCNRRSGMASTRSLPPSPRLRPATYG